MCNAEHLVTSPCLISGTVVQLQAVAPKKGCSAADGRLIMCALRDWIHKDVAVSTVGMDCVEAACCCVA